MRQPLIYNKYLVNVPSSQCLGIWSAECLVRVLEPQGYPAGLVRQDPCSQLMTLPALTSLLTS